MFFSSRSLLAIAFSMTAASSGVGCAGRPLDSKVASSADSAGYAARYPDALDSAVKRFDADKRSAYDLTSGLLARTRDVSDKPGADRAILLKIVEESDRSGRGQSYARARSDERAMRAFWDDERGALSSRVSSAAQKDVLDAGCTQQVELNGSVQHAMRDGIDKQLERRARAENDGQRTLEQNKARLAPGSIPALQRLSDDIALASHLSNVALVDDARELTRLLSERASVEDTLKRMLEEERALQSDPRKPTEQKASQERVIQIEKSRAALEPKSAEAEAALKDHEEQLKLAQNEYDNTIEAIKASFRDSPPVSQPAAVSVKP
ncbi:MAG: hypothetical protein JWN48_207 [Myxococcaceae bacterium]|nr:hypothetical protein [Myxococcaceae bacterium]